MTGNFEPIQGLKTLRTYLEQRGDADALAEFTIHEQKLLENLRREKLFGSNEVVRSERSQVIFVLNEFTRQHCGVTFNELCMGVAIP